MAEALTGLSLTRVDGDPFFNPNLPTSSMVIRVRQRMDDGDSIPAATLGALAEGGTSLAMTGSGAVLGGAAAGAVSEGKATGAGAFPGGAAMAAVDENYGISEGVGNLAADGADAAGGLIGSMAEAIGNEASELAAPLVSGLLDMVAPNRGSSSHPVGN